MTWYLKETLWNARLAELDFRAITTERKLHLQCAKFVVAREFIAADKGKSLSHSNDSTDGISRRKAGSEASERTDGVGIEWKEAT